MTEPSQLAAALAAFQAELPRLGKGNTAQVKSDKGNYSYKYADLATVSATALPLLGKHGLSFSAKPMLAEDGRFVLRYILRHTSGESDGGDFPLAQAARPQEIGSLLTYARRYCLLAVTGLAPDEDDDDGTAAKEVSIEAKAREPEKVWDPIEQQVLYDGWASEIAKATAGDIARIAQSLLKQKRAGELSPTNYQKLGALGGRRKAELDAEAANAAGGGAS